MRGFTFKQNSQIDDAKSKKKHGITEMYKCHF